MPSVENRGFLLPAALFAPDFNSVIPVVGVLLIFLCFVAYFFPPARSLREKNQVFEGAGVKMQVSVLTVFVIMGLVLSMSSFALQYKGYLDQEERFAKKEKEYNDQLAALRGQLNAETNRNHKERQFNMNILLKPTAAAGPVDTSAGDWQCTYRVFSLTGDAPPPVKAPVAPGPSSNSVRITLQNITFDTKLDSITLRSGKRTWRSGTFTPFTDAELYMHEDDEEDADEQ